MSKTTTYSVPCTYNGKQGTITINLDHDALHITRGAGTGVEFYRSVATKLKNLFPNKSELTLLNGESLAQKEFSNGYGEKDIDHLIIRPEFWETNSMDYTKILGHELNPVGMTMTFDYDE